MANVVVLSGEVKRVFDERKVDGGLVSLAFSLQFKDGKRNTRIVVGAFGDEKEGGIIDQARKVSDGDKVLIQGKLRENSWKKEGEETWTSRMDVQPTSIEVASDEDDDDIPE